MFFFSLVLVCMMQAETEYIIEYLPIPESSGLETSVLGLNVQLEPRHFRNGAMELKCTATIGNGYWVRKMIVAEANINAQPSIPGHNRLLSSGEIIIATFIFIRVTKIIHAVVMHTKMYVNKQACLYFNPNNVTCY